MRAGVQAKLALATCESMVVPLSFDDGDFNRLFQDVTGNALFTDVAASDASRGASAREGSEDGVHQSRRRRHPFCL